MIFLPPSHHVVDRNGSPLARAQLRFRIADTTLALTVYQDPERTSPHPEVVTADMAGRFPPVYLPFATTGVTTYTAECRSAGGGVVYEVPGLALPVQAAAGTPATFALPLAPVSTSGTATIVNLTPATFRGVLTVNASSIDIPVVLPPHASLTPGQSIVVRQSGFGAAVVVQSADGLVPVGAAAYLPLSERGEEATIIATATGFVVVHESLRGPLYMIASRSSSAPTSPPSGALYIATATVGAWVAGRIYRAAGGGGAWIAVEPRPGALAIVLDELVAGSPTPYTWSGSDWVKWSGIIASAQVLIAQVQASSGAPGGTPVYGSWTRTPINAIIENTIAGAALSSGNLTLPLGTYDVEGWRAMSGTMASAVRLRSPSSSLVVRGPSVYLQGETVTVAADTAGNLTTSQSAPAAGDIQIATRVGAAVPFAGRLVTTGADSFQLEYWASQPIGASSNIDLGVPLAIAGEAEVYANLTIRKRA